MSYVEPFTREEIIELAKAAYDKDWYDDAYMLKRFLVGDYDYTKSLRDQPDGRSRGTKGSTKGDILPVYGDVADNLGKVGVQNHALVNSRINVWNIIFTTPNFDCDLIDASESSLNDAWVRKMWDIGNWSNPLSDAGFSFETCGVGFCKLGSTPDGRVHMKYQDVHDSLWDFMNRNPADWEWFLFREHISIRDAMKKYGHLWHSDSLDSKQNMKLAEKELRKLSASYATGTSTGSGTFQVIAEWEFWHNNAHCVFLGGLNNGIMLNIDEKGRYNMADPLNPRDKMSMAGENPFKCKPVISFTDTTLPNVRRPVGKKKTSLGPIGMANRIERGLERVAANMGPINLLATGALEPDVLIALKKKMDGNSTLSLDELGEVVMVDTEDVAKAILRVQGQPLDQSLLQWRSIMKQEINAAEGVDDASRGQRSASERITAEEIRRFADVQGGQADHMRKQYSIFMSQLWTVSRKIGSDYFWWSGTINFQHNGRLVPYDLSRYPIKPFLAKDSIGTATPDSLLYMSEESRRQKRAERLSMVDSIFIKLGVFDPKAVAADVYREMYGITDISPYLAPPAPPGVMPGAPNQIPPEADAAMREAQHTAKQT